MTRTNIHQERVAHLIKPYPGQWVTLSSDKTHVLGASRRMETALSKASQKGEPRPLLIKVPDSATAAFFY